MSNEVQEALDRLFEPTAARPKSRPVSEAAEAEAAELHALAERVGRLHEVCAPRRLREHGLEFVFSQPIPVRQRRLWLIPPPDRRGQLFRAVSQIAASAAAVLVLGFSAASASSGSLPDSPLYNVRLLTEEVQVALAPPEQRPHIYVAQAQRHKAESLELLEQNKPEVAQRSVDDAVRRIDSAKQAAERIRNPEPARTIVAAVEPAVLEVRDRVALVAEATPPRNVAQPVTLTSGQAVVVVPPIETAAAEPPTSLPEATPVPPSPVPSVNVAAPGSSEGFTAIQAPPPTPTEASAVVSAPQTPFLTIAAGGDATPAPSPTSVTVSGPAPTFLPIGSNSTATPRPTQSATATSTPSRTPTATVPAPTATVVPPTNTSVPATGGPPTASPTRTPTAQAAAPANGFTPL